MRLDLSRREIWRDQLHATSGELGVQRIAVVGVIWQTGPAGGAVTSWAASPFLTTTGVPPFEANGIAFNCDRSMLFVANTGNDTVLRIPVATRTAEVFVNSINGADGLIIEEDDIRVAANQAGEIVVVEPKHGQFLYVTNLSLDGGQEPGRGKQAF